MSSPAKKEWSKGFLLWFWFPFASLCFVAGGLASVYYFDGPFDWRYRTLTTLSSPSNNPHGYVFCCLGLILSFAMGMPFCDYFKVRFEPIAPKTARFSARALKVGFAGAVAVGLERLFSKSIPLHIHKGHEVMSIITFVGLLLGIAGFWFCLSRWLRRERQWPAWMISALFVFSLGPIIGTGLSQAYLYFVPNNLGWVGPRWAEMGVPLYLSFAFWEWLTCAGILIYLYFILLFLPSETPASRTEATASRPVDLPDEDPSASSFPH